MKDRDRAQEAVRVLEINRERLDARIAADGGFQRTHGEIHDTPRVPFEKGAASLFVGFCELYDGGPHVLLTLDQPHAERRRDLEIALTPVEAIVLARYLLNGADDMTARSAEMEREANDGCEAVVIFGAIEGLDS